MRIAENDKKCSGQLKEAEVQFDEQFVISIKISYAKRYSQIIFFKWMTEPQVSVREDAVSFLLCWTFSFEKSLKLDPSLGKPSVKRVVAAHVIHLGLSHSPQQREQ